LNAPHTAGVIVKILDEVFDNRTVSNHHPEEYGKGLAWPSLPPDLSPCYFFLRGYLKDRGFRKINETFLS
jgi:hypothetical protein